jgi:diguanylate cyclase (GGDEF)-like protein/PAS domain S-box-containing protein
VCWSTRFTALLAHADDSEWLLEMTKYEIDDVDTSSSLQARSALLTAAVLSFVGSGIGIAAINSGAVNGAEIVLVVVGGVYGLGSLVTLLTWKRLPVQKLAAASVTFYTAYLSTGILVSLLCRGNHQNLFVYLVWFFTLLVFNKLVNVPAAGRLFSRVILAAPLVIVCCLVQRVLALFPVDSIYMVATTCLCYLCFGLMLDAVTEYREAYIVERERAESLRIKSEVLESISDCFISLDSEFRLVYLNDAACSEFAVDRRAALNHNIIDVAPGFFSEAMLAGLRAALERSSATTFEAQRAKDVWYEIRCFPRRDHMSIHFRNITETVLSRQQLEAAHDRLREQSNLLDKAQDAIFVQDMDSRILYWNQGAERLFGWTAAAVTGMRVGDVFQTSAPEVRHAFLSVEQQGEWSGELQKKHKDGRDLIVASRCTLVRNSDGSPHSILAINTDITERKVADARIYNLAFHDVLTGLPNRALLRERLEKALLSSARLNNSGALLLIDLDDFKTLNDTSGHDVGDRLLQEVATRLNSCIRGSGTAARLGGDEFVVLLEGLSLDPEIAIRETSLIGDVVVRACRRPYVLRHQVYEGTASVGVTLFNGAADTGEELLKRADLALYRAKAQGRDSLCFFDPGMESAAASRVALLADLKSALHADEFELHYQPQVNTTHKVVSCEALLRWRHPVRGMVPPDEFIPLAEADGLIVDLGYWVLDTACEQLAAWALKPEMQELSMSVNVSIRQFLDSRFVQFVERSLRVSGADPRKLKFEITESFMMERVDDVIHKMAELKKDGIGFSMDDFGTGYSSLSQLKRLPLDLLEIDQSFVRDVLTGVMDASIVRTIIALGKSLNLAVIAEGVETEEQRKFLEEQGCFAYQGYLFSPALRALEFEAFAAGVRPEKEMTAV